MFLSLNILATSSVVHLRHLFLRGLDNSSVNRFVLDNESALVLALDFLMSFNRVPREITAQKGPPHRYTL